jgi:hypothetical protein
MRKKDKFMLKEAGGNTKNKGINELGSSEVMKRIIKEGE